MYVLRCFVFVGEVPQKSDVCCEWHHRFRKQFGYFQYHINIKQVVDGGDDLLVRLCGFGEKASSRMRMMRAVRCSLVCDVPLLYLVLM